MPLFSLIIFFFVVIILIFSLMVLHKLFSFKGKAVAESKFEIEAGSNLERRNIFYPKLQFFAVIYLIFNVLLIFLFIWSLFYNQVGLKSLMLIEILCFIGVTLFGYIILLFAQKQGWR